MGNKYLMAEYGMNYPTMIVNPMINPMMTGMIPTEPVAPVAPVAPYLKDLYLKRHHHHTCKDDEEPNYLQDLSGLSIEFQNLYIKQGYICEKKTVEPVLA